MTLRYGVAAALLVGALGATGCTAGPSRHPGIGERIEALAPVVKAIPGNEAPGAGERRERGKP